MPTKKSTTKQGRFSSLLSKLNPNSPKKKLLLFVLVFGLLAGGFYAYRSFAATTAGVVRFTFSAEGVAQYTYSNNVATKQPATATIVTPDEAWSHDKDSTLVWRNSSKDQWKNAFSVITGIKADKLINAGDSVVALPGNANKVRMCVDMSEQAQVTTPSVLMATFYFAPDSPVDGNGQVVANRAQEALKINDRGVVAPSTCTKWQDGSSVGSDHVRYVFGISAEVNKGNLRIKGFRVEWK